MRDINMEGNDTAQYNNSFRLNLSPTSKSPTKKKLTIFSRNISANGEEGESLELRGLISPRLEKELQKEKRKGLGNNSSSSLKDVGGLLLSPVRSVQNAFRGAGYKKKFGRSPKRSPKKKNNSDSDDDDENSNDLDDDDDDKSYNDDNSSDNDNGEEFEKSLTEGEMMLLLARELQLIDDDDDDDE